MKTLILTLVTLIILSGCNDNSKTAASANRTAKCTSSRNLTK